MAKYQPELGQYCFGCPTGEFRVPDYADALLAGLLSEIDRVFWNVNQRRWDRCEDPEIPGVTFRPYWWGDEDAPESLLPNFEIGDGVEIRWYKHPGRGMSCNRELTPAEWADWFQRGYAMILAADTKIGGE